jgi:hypothetical protein
MILGIGADSARLIAGVKGLDGAADSCRRRGHATTQRDSDLPPKGDRRQNGFQVACGVNFK